MKKFKNQEKQKMCKINLKISKESENVIKKFKKQ